MRGTEPPWDITAGLDAFKASDLAPVDRTEGAIFIIRDWIIARGLLEAPPDPEQAN